MGSPDYERPTRFQLRKIYSNYPLAESIIQDLVEAGFAVPDPDECETCRGTGHVYEAMAADLVPHATCKACRGTGKRRWAPTEAHMQEVWNGYPSDMRDILYTILEYAHENPYVVGLIDLENLTNDEKYHLAGKLLSEIGPGFGIIIDASKNK